MKNNAKRRGYVWDLTDEQVRELTAKPCFYCNIASAQKKTNYVNHNDTYIYNGLDRVNNEEAYLITNVVPCCGACNKAKNTMTQDEFLAWIARVYKHSVSKEK